MVALLIATVFAFAAGLGTWLLDQRLLRCRTRLRAAVATSLTAVATWTAVLIQSALLLEIPGAYGPVQYWHNDPGAMDFMMTARVLALFLMFPGWLLAALTPIVAFVSLLSPADGNRWNRLVVPTVALAVFGLAISWLGHYDFLPSA